MLAFHGWSQAKEIQTRSSLSRPEVWNANLVFSLLLKTIVRYCHPFLGQTYSWPRQMLSESNCDPEQKNSLALSLNVTWEKVENRREDAKFQLMYLLSFCLFPDCSFKGNTCWCVKGKVSLRCKPNQTWFYGYVQYTDQFFLSSNAKERHGLEKELYVPRYFWKISKAALLKEKRAQLWNHFLLFKLFYSRKKTRGYEKKIKNLFYAFDLFLGLSIPPALRDDAVCQIPTAPVSASSSHSPPHTITLLSEAAGTLPAHADSITAWRTALLWGSSSPLGARQKGMRRAGHGR